MTNEMKENIIKYLTGNITEETPSEDLIYSNVVSNTNDLASELDTKYGANNWNIIDIIQGTNNELSLLYGSYNVSGQQSDKGFMVIIDKNGNPIQIIDEFTSGVKIGNILGINVDEDGQFYMIETSVENNVNRFVMLNNILVKLSTVSDYSVKIRRSYNIPSSSPAYYASYVKIIKAVGQSKYLIGGKLPSSQGTGVFVTELVVQVGATNEWNTYLGSTSNIPIDENIDLYANWTDNDFNMILLAYPTSYSNYLLKYTKSSSILTYSNINISFPNHATYNNPNSKILNDQVAYFAISGQRNDNSNIYDNNIYKINLTNNTSSLLYNNTGYYNTDNPNLTVINLKNIANEIVFIDCTLEVDSEWNYTYKIGRIREDSAYYTNPISTNNIVTITKFYQEYFDYPILYVNKNFNLYNFNLIVFDVDNNDANISTTYTTYQIYNSLNYNGSSFEGIKSLLPNSAILYDSNGNVIFARNLYNKVISGETTTSTIEVPNNYINDITISTQNLLSFNNNTLISDTEDLVKNQYETLNINFINKINMINKNNINNPITNVVGATALNNSMSNDIDYSDKSIGKVKLNYADNTNYIKSINNANSISQFVYQYEFTFYNNNSNKVVSIDIISEDESVVYQTIDTSSLTPGKTYRIIQNVEIQ